MIKCFYIALYLFCFVALNTSFSQSNREIANIIATAEREFERTNFFGAAKLFDKAYNKTSNRYDIAFLAAQAYRLDNDYERSEYFYNIVVQNNPDRYPDAFFYLAKMKKANENYFRAQYYFNQYYLNNKEDTANVKVVRAKKEIADCEFAWRTVRNPIDVQISTFKSVINTVNSEFSPAFANDSTLLFSSIRRINDTSNIYKSDIYYSRFRDSAFTKEQRLCSVINMPDYDIANPFVTENGKYLYFSAKKTNNNGNSHIYRSRFNEKENSWEEPFKLPDIINLEGYNSIHPSVTEINGTEILLWSSDRPGGEGNYDIWFSAVLSDNRFGVVRNIGRPVISDLSAGRFIDTTSDINTRGNEISPFYNKYDSTLYFSSDWHTGLGGFDIFKIKGDFKKWDSVKNLGYPINTGQNDFYFRKYSNLGYAIFTSNRKGSPADSHYSCCNAIYYYKIDKIEKEIEVPDEEIIAEKQLEKYKEEARLLVPIKLFFDNDRPVPRSWDTVTDINYKYSFYKYIDKIDEYVKEYSRGLEGENKKNAIKDVKYFFNNEVKENFSKLQEFSELLILLLQEGQTIEITIKGFTSPLNVAEYNINLSKRRIASLVNYFYEYNDGYFRDYIRDEQMNFEFVAYGKSMASETVSADPDDLRSSVYSPEAARERRIEIIAVAIENLIE